MKMCQAHNRQQSRTSLSGGDAIPLSGTDLVWFDYVTNDKTARQHIVLGDDASGRWTMSQ